MKLLGAGGTRKPTSTAPASTRMRTVSSEKSFGSSLSAIKDTDQRTRLFNALRMDNRAPWFQCVSHWTVAQLERRFAEELVGSVLYERIGGLLQGDGKTVYMQIALVRTTIERLHPDAELEWLDVPLSEVWPDDMVLEALNDIRVTVSTLVPDIRTVIASGRF